MMSNNNDFNWDEETNSFVETTKSNGSEAPKVDELKDDSSIKLVDGQFVDVEKTDEPDKTTDSTDSIEVVNEDIDDTFQLLAKDLKELGILEVDIPEEIDQNSFFDLMKKNNEKGIESYFDSFMEDLDDDAKAFLEFKKNGGDTSVFFSTYSQIEAAPNLDSIETFEDKMNVIRYYAGTYDNKKGEELEDFLTFIEDQGKVDVYSEMYSGKIKEIQDLEKAKLLENRLKIVEKQKESINKFVDETIRYVTSDESDIVFTDSEKKNMKGYISSASVKIDGSTYITKMQKDLSDALADPKKAAKLAKFLMGGMDFTNVVKEIQEKEINKFESALKKARSKSVNSPSGKKIKSKGGFNIDDYV